MSHIWVVRAGRNAAYIDTFLTRSVVALGMSNLLGPDSLRLSRDELVQAMTLAHPEQNKFQIANQAGQLYRYLHELKVGDTVASYDPDTRMYWLGEVASEPRFDLVPLEDAPYLRSMNWQRKVPRDALTVETRNSLGAIQSIFRLGREASKEMRDAAVAATAPAPAGKLPSASKEPSLGAAELYDETRQKSATFIEDSISQLDAWQLQEFVAGLLRAMGYKTRVSPRGSDRGVDIFASPDGLGLEQPRIFVEVKHRPATAISAPDVRAFIGGRQSGDRCLYVSTGGFTREARYEAERSSVPLTLVALPDLRELLVEHYDALDSETRRLVPLAKLYWPISVGGG